MWLEPARLGLFVGPGLEAQDDDSAAMGAVDCWFNLPPSSTPFRMWQT